MKKFIPVLVLFLFSLNGCLVFHKMSYDIKMDGPNNGTATVIFNDIRSDAQGQKEFEGDTTNLFSYILSDPQFIQDLKKEGKNIVTRQLSKSGDTLNGKLVYTFDNINFVEKIIYEDGFYYITLPLEDSILSTNGEIIHSKEYKRIIWDGKETNLKFEMFSTNFSSGDYRKLEQYYKPGDKRY